MKYKNFELLMLLGLFWAAIIPVVGQKAKVPVPVILDTDIGPDYDDAGAMAVFHALADQGEVKPLAVISCNKHELVVPTIDILNTCFGRPNLPTGAPKGKAVNAGAGQKWPEMLVQKYPHKFTTTAAAPDAVQTYRKVLASQPDKSVTIITIGFLTNLADLLESSPDENSKLTGTELVRQKVKNLVSMAGAFPQGREYNVYMDTLSAAKVFEAWPTSITLSGYEIGSQVRTGLRVIANEKLQGPVKDVFTWCMARSEKDRNGRQSWDQTAVLVGIRGVAPYFGSKRGHIVVNRTDGSNTWQDDLTGPHIYLTEAMPFVKVTEEIENLMMQPGRSAANSKGKKK
ncbi:nucleoside hydrolase [Adhaeribacter aquaticus]|uniref:nucleoside hydrolase n=1 Tax=Adhaeribacter aquaticus TaxID=299567 RepID=UPI0004203BF3|nr:nucleoside hydrolase [Adhaeribacter aquaticus]